MSILSRWFSLQQLSRVITNAMWIFAFPFFSVHLSVHRPKLSASHSLMVSLCTWCGPFLLLVFHFQICLGYDLPTTSIWIRNPFLTFPCESRVSLYIPLKSLFLCLLNWGINLWRIDNLKYWVTHPGGWNIAYVGGSSFCLTVQLHSIHHNCLKYILE